MPIVNWNKEQEEIIKKLRSNSEIFTKILEEDRECLVIKSEDREKLYNLISRSKKLLEKIEGKKFTVAIVGLEKSGKSTFGNALLQLDVLPNEFQRCTFTTTTIYSGSEDIGKIEFYTRDEFNKYFNALLKAIKYSKDLDDFTDLDIVTFENFWSEQSEKNREVYEKYDSSIAKDIKTIINNKSDITPFLDEPIKTFVGVEKLESNDFKKYITGIKDHDEKGLVIRSAIPYSVKCIKIQSTNLGDMKDIVLYDVPGFDSPTDLHKKQTLEMLKGADSIILVASLGGDNAHLTGTHLDMLKKGRDEDNVTLADKTFVFGNKLDRADDSQDAQLRIEVLKKDVIDEHKIVKENHFFVGSAKEYLDKKKVKDSDDNSKVDFRLGKLGFSDGIEELKESMFEYYNNDRFDILAKRAENILNEAKFFLNSICKDFSESNSEAIGRDYAVEATLSLSRKLKTFYERSNEITSEYLDDISKPQNLPFSSSIIEKINEIYPYENENSKNLRTAKLNTNIDSDNIYPETIIDSTLRGRLKVDFSKEIVKRIDNKIYEEENKIYEKLTEEFLNIMEAKKDSHFYDEMKNSVRCIFDEILRDHGEGEKCRFNTLVERFNTSLIEAVIKTPFASTERLNKIKGRNTLPEFFSLSAYYAMNTDDSDDEIGIDNENLRMKIFSQILAHKDIVKVDKTEIKNSFDKFFEENKKVISKGTDLALNLIPMKKIMDIFSQSGAKLENLKSELEDLFYNDSWEKQDSKTKLDMIVKTVKNTCKYEDKEYKNGLVNALDMLHKEARKKKEALDLKIEAEAKNGIDKNKLIEQNILNLINEDIDILRDITVKSVLKAIGLERAFSSTISNNIDLIRKELEKQEDSKFDKWIKDNIAKIKENEFEKIEIDRKNYEIKKNVFEYIDKLRSELN